MSEKTIQIIISPAKKMEVRNDLLPPVGLPVYIEKTQQLLQYMKSLDYGELKAVWKCNDKIAEQNYERIRHMKLDCNLIPAILSYEGIQYKYMAPAVFEEKAYRYLEKHLYILSGFYGALRPFDGVTPYRLEMQARFHDKKLDSLYDFWGRELAELVLKDCSLLVNLASKEYSKCIEKYLTPHDRYITINFYEKSGDKLVSKGTYAKMARGEMVRFMAEREIENPEEIRKFDRLGYTFRRDLSSESEYVFERK